MQHEGPGWGFFFPFVFYNFNLIKTDSALVRDYDERGLAVKLLPSGNAANQWKRARHATGRSRF